jgi:malonate transporter MadL subunit
MLIKGVALLSGCFILGQLIGETLGRILHIDANVGGVGFAMILLIFSQNYLEKRGLFNPEMESGVMFWSKMYIPVIVAIKWHGSFIGRNCASCYLLGNNAFYF